MAREFRRHVGPQFRHGLFRKATGQVRLPEHHFRIERHCQIAGEAIGDCFPRLARGIAGPVGQDQVDAALVAIEDEAAARRQVQFGCVGLAGIGDEDVLPADAVGGLVARIEHPARKVLEEHSGADIVLHPLGDDLEGDFPEGLIRVRNRLDHHVHGDRGSAGGHEEHRPEQPIGADAAGEERHRLPIRRQPAKADQQSGEQRHRNGEAEGLGDQGEHDPAGDLPGDALGDQHLEVAHDRGDFEQERENDQRQQERRDDLADHVAIDRSQHQRSCPLSGLPRPNAKQASEVGRPP